MKQQFIISHRSFMSKVLKSLQGMGIMWHEKVYTSFLVAANYRMKKAKRYNKTSCRNVYVYLAL